MAAPEQNPSWIAQTRSALNRFGLERLLRYGVVGGIAALVHAATAALAYHSFHIDPTISNLIGYLCGGIISYLGSYYFTFNLKSGHGYALPRFLAAWILGLVINVGLFKVGLERVQAPFMVNVFVAIVLTPIMQFALLRFWAFRHALDG